MRTDAAPDIDDTPAPRQGRLLALLLGLLVLVFVLVFDWNWFKGPVQAQVSAYTGREFRIDGDLALEPGLFRPTFIAHDVVLGNADWASEDRMFEARRVSIQWAMWHILLGRVVLPEVRLDGATLNLERDAELRANWQFREPRSDPMPTRGPRIDQLWVKDGRFRLIEATRRTDLAVDVESGEPTAEGRPAPLHVHGGGTYRDYPFTIQGRIGSPVHLVRQAEDQRYWIDLEAEAGQTRARVAGGLHSVLQLQDFDLDFAISGQDMAELYPLLGLAIPETAPYDLTGRLARTGTVWSYRGMKGTVGESDLAGDVGVDAGRERKLLTADLVSDSLDLDDLAGFVGGRPQAPDPDRDRFFPSQPYDTSKLRSMDAEIALVAKRLRSEKLPLESMDARLVLVDGDLRLDPLDFGMAGGQVAGRVHLDARQQPIAAEVALQARGLELPRLFPKAAGESTGSIGGRLDIRGRGDSVAALMATADGELGAAMGRGRISNLTMELAGLDIAEALRFSLGKDRVVPVRCAYADFGVQDGVATARAVAFDTTDTLLTGEGRVLLGEERFDLELKPQPKDFSPLALRSPLRVTGTFRDPNIRPQGGPLLLRSAAAAALYALAPPAALIALVETGPGEDADCGGGEEPEAEDEPPPESGP